MFLRVPYFPDPEAALPARYDVSVLDLITDADDRRWSTSLWRSQVSAVVCLLTRNCLPVYLTCTFLFRLPSAVMWPTSRTGPATLIVRNGVTVNTNISHNYSHVSFLRLLLFCFPAFERWTNKRCIFEHHSVLWFVRSCISFFRLSYFLCHLKLQYFTHLLSRLCMHTFTDSYLQALTTRTCIHIHAHSDHCRAFQLFKLNIAFSLFSTLDALVAA